MVNKIFKLWPVLLLPAFLIAFTGKAYAEDTKPAADKEKIYDGVYIDSLYVGGLTKEQAEESLEKYVSGMKGKKLILTSDVGEYEIGFDELNISDDYEPSVEEALQYGRNGNILKRYKEIKTLESSEAVIVSHKKIDESVLSDKLENDAWALMKQAQNASLTRQDDKFIVYPGENGVSLMIDRTVKAVSDKLAKEAWKDKDIKMEAVCKVTKPEYSEDDFYGVDSLLGRYRTVYTSKDPDRNVNLITGTNKIAGTIVLPGHQFSMYNKVAPFTEENGYLNAGQYFNDEFVDGLGGGICQVATTLYNAVLEAELPIDERYPHSRPTNYVDKGRDAAIAEGYMDFKFTNNTKYPIYIDAYAGGGVISVAIYGHEERPSNRTISFESKIVETFSPGEDETIYDKWLPSGTEKVTPAHEGYYVELWKHIYVDGELKDSVKINGSQYNASGKKTRVGTG